MLAPAGMTTDKLNSYINRLFVSYSLKVWTEKKEMNFPAGGTERVLLRKKAFYSNIPVGSTPGFNSTEKQNNFKSI